MKEKKKLYDYRIEYDTKSLPKELQDIIKEMEELSDKGDNFTYDIVFDYFEIEAKGYVRRGILSFSDYNLLLRKYGWLLYE